MIYFETDNYLRIGLEFGSPSEIKTFIDIIKSLKDQDVKNYKESLHVNGIDDYLLKES